MIEVFGKQVDYEIVSRDLPLMPTPVVTYHFDATEGNKSNDSDKCSASTLWITEERSSRRRLIRALKSQLSK